MYDNQHLKLLWTLQGKSFRPLVREVYGIIISMKYLQFRNRCTMYLYYVHWYFVDKMRKINIVKTPNIFISFSKWLCTQFTTEQRNFLTFEYHRRRGTRGGHIEWHVLVCSYFMQINISVISIKLKRVCQTVKSMKNTKHEQLYRKYQIERNKDWLYSMKVFLMTEMIYVISTYSFEYKKW